MADKSNVVSLGSRRNWCEECTLTDRCIARDLDNVDRDGRYDIAVTPRVVRRGDRLFRTGDSFEALYMVRSGAVKTFMITPAGDEQVIGFHMPGDIIGLDAIEHGRYACNADALDTSSICVLPFERLSRLCTRSRTVLSRLLKGFSHKLLHDEAMLVMLGQKSAEERLAAFLIDQAERRREQGYSAHDINLPMSRSDIGSYLALAVETVSRVLTRLQGAGLLEVQRNHIRIVDFDALAAIAQEGGVPVPRRMKALK